MKTTSRHSRTLRVKVVLAIAAVFALTAAPAWADTSQASARAVQLHLAGEDIVDSGTFSASNDGSGEQTSGDTGPALSVLGNQDVIQAGVLVQQAQANDDGTSAACAGVIGDGGLIQIGEGGDCTAEQFPTGGVEIDLGTPVLVADAILAECIATTEGVAGNATLLNATVAGINIPVDPGPNTVVGVPGVLTIVLNEQTLNNDGSLTVTAMHITVLGALGTPLIELWLGTVTCGPNASTPPINAFAPGGLPLAAAVAVLGGGAVWLTVRRRRALTVG
jgi:hypothetical protein